MTNSIEQYQQRITFFEKSAETKNQITKSEADRLRLEIELNKLINSEQAQVKSKGSKLKAYYTKLCEDEAQSLKRNQRLLANLQRVDSQFQQLESKLDRLSNLKKECEVYLRSAYPVWTAENKIFPNENVNHPTVNLNTPINRTYELLANSSSSQIPHKHHNDVETPYKSDHYEKLNDKQQPDSGLHALMTAIKTSFHNQPDSNNISQDLIKNDANQASANKSHQTSALQNLVSSVLTGPHLTPNQSENLPQESKHVKKNDFISQLVTSAYNHKPIDRNQEQLLNHLDTNQTFQQANNINNDTLIKEYERELKRQDTNMVDFTLTSSLNYLNPLQSTSAVDNQQVNLQQQLREHFNQESKGLDLNKWSDSPILHKNDYKIENKEALLVSDDNSEIKRKNSLRQELNLDALYYLLDYIELEMTHTIHPEKYYRQVEPHYKNKLEIIRLARDNKPLSDMDPADVTMVVLDQLPMLIRKNTLNKCLFTSDLMGLSVTDINEKVVGNYLKDNNDKALWQRLLKHWNFLKRLASMDAHMIAEKFSSALIGVNTNGIEKAIKILEKIISSNSSNEPFNESKSMTETSINQELLLASSSKLKESSVYQDFIMNTTHTAQKVSHQSKIDHDDDDDEIDAMVAPKSTGGSGNSKNYVLSNTLIKSPRQNVDYEFDFSQNSMSESQKKAISLKQSLRSSKDKKLPAHLRDFDSSDNDSSESTETQSKLKNKSIKSDSDFDFYN